MSYQPVEVSTKVYSQAAKLDNYINDHLLRSDPALESTLKTNAAANLAAIDVAPNQGKLLYLLAKLNNSKAILEVGTLGGYSATWFAKAVGEGGKVVTLEIDPETAEVAKGNIERAGFGNIVDIKVGAAADTLKSFSILEPKPKFDFVFIDADKENNLTYFKYALEFSRIGTVIVVDNIARRGRLADLDCDAADVVGTRKLFEYLKKEEDSGTSRVESSALQTLGSKGWDGFLIATVVA